MFGRHRLRVRRRRGEFPRQFIHPSRPRCLTRPHIEHAVRFLSFRARALHHRLRFPLDPHRLERSTRRRVTHLPRPQLHRRRVRARRRRLLTRRINLQRALSRALALRSRVVAPARAVRVAAAAAGASPTPLEILSLRGNHIGDDGIDAITDILPNLPRLHTLDVSDCDLTAVAVRRLAESSSSRTFAATLSRNPGIDRTAVAALAREFDDLAFARGLDGF
mmetsp:Transcript_8151/g.32572  ORF Transcript_8151/g.32572 Transcript_8151/m.32572 type:complete len:221 (+) Transcript_8151:820-1482(+)